MFPNIEKPVLLRVYGKQEVLLDDSSEGLSHELDGVIPVAKAHVQLTDHVLQYLDVSYSIGGEPLRCIS